MWVFEEWGKPEYLEKNLSEQGRELTNSTHIWLQRWDLNLGHIGGRRVLSLLCHLSKLGLRETGFHFHCRVNSLSPKIHIQILQTDLNTFPYRIS